MMNRKRKQRGFTLMEVLLVLAIIGMMAGIAVFAMVGQREGAKKDITIIKIKEIGRALDAYNMNIGHYPNEEEGGLQALLAKPNYSDEKIGANWRGPYLTEVPRDGWNNEIHYQLNTQTSTGSTQPAYILSSNGPDGQDGTDDDLKNWSESAGTL
jgi:general secretion pathway protein G